MSHRRASKLSVKLVAKPCRDLNNRKSLADNPHRQIPQKMDWNTLMESNRIQKYRNFNARTKPNAQFHFVSENTLIWFQLRWKQQPSQSSTTSDNCAAAVCVFVCVGGPQQTLEPRLESLSMLALPCHALPCLGCWLNVKLRVSARATCGARLRIVTVTVTVTVRVPNCTFE